MPTRLPLFLRNAALGLAAVLAATASLRAQQPADAVLEDKGYRLEWKLGEQGWQLSSALVRGAQGNRSLVAPSGEYTLLYSAEEPPAKTEPLPRCPSAPAFPEPVYIHTTRMWTQATSPVALNVAGRSFAFFPSDCSKAGNGALVFRKSAEPADLVAEWRPNPGYPGEILVTLTLVAKKDGYFSLATPALGTFPQDKLAWAMVPGVFAGRSVNPDLLTAYGYGQGLPDRPVLARERVASSLLSVATQTDGLSLAVVAEPGTAADPWETDRNTREKWKLGLSHMNRRGELSPTLWHPVLGQDGSRLKAGERCTFSFRYTLRQGDWYGLLEHTAYDIYRLDDNLALRRNRASLSVRMERLHRYLTDAETSRWRVEDFQGYRLGAQRYGSDKRSGVVGSDADAMKNSDYGAMWMLAKLTGDPKIVRERLPFARDFKLAQQQKEPGFFQGAAVGQYYLFKSKRFVEEWGNYVEPVGLTYYTLSDFGNILLFSPSDSEARVRLRLGADKLLSWQRFDGSWEVAYDHESHSPLFRELNDYRPTFYGLLIAWRALGDEKYLAAAKRGADWIVENAVKPQRYLGVCGDARFAPDFATAQIAQALLDLAEATGEAKYREAGISATRFYVSSIFTHPLATRAKKTVKGVAREDWEISQSGLGYEHGGILGSANPMGPILLASHAGLFIRVHQLTGDPLLRDLARAAVVGRDAFVEPATSVASYYWVGMNAGAGSFPHHAWWQIGWITDYLLSEASLRSEGRIAFPRGFFTPKVGPHASYGFAPGKLFGESVDLGWAAVDTGNPDVEHVLARSRDGKRLYVLLLNDRPDESVAKVSAASLGSSVKWSSARLLDALGKASPLSADAALWELKLPPYGLVVLQLDTAR